MANTVRFYDYDVVDGAGNYNDGSVADGTTGKGRFVLTVDPFTAPSGTDGQFLEFDFVVDDPADTSRVFWGWVGINVAASPTLVTGGFTFDSAAPATFDYWGCFRDTKADYDAYVASPHLVVGATNYARNNATFYDGAYQIQGLGFVVAVDAASASNWYVDAPLPPSTPPTITAPAGGATYTPDDDLAVTVTWTEPGTEIDSQVITSGAFVSDSGSLAGALTHDVIVPYGVSGSITISVRAKQTGKDWSTYSTVTITVTPDVDTPDDCFDVDALAESPDVLWLFRDPSPRQTVADLSGNGRDGTLENVLQVTYSTGTYGYQDHHATPASSILLETDAVLGGGGASPPAVGTTGYAVLAYLVVYASSAPTLTLPSGWSIFATEDKTATDQSVLFILYGPASATYPWTVGVTGTIFGYAFTVQMIPDWLTPQAGSLQVSAEHAATAPTPASWDEFQVQVCGYFSEAGAGNEVLSISPTSEWEPLTHTAYVGILTHGRISPANVTPSITYGSTAPPKIWLAQIVLEDLGHLQSPRMDQADAAPCDGSCADVNGVARFQPEAFTAFGLGQITAVGYDPSSLTEWSVEAAAKLIDSTDGAVYVEPIHVAVPAAGSTRASFSNFLGDDEGRTVRQTSCWMHVILESSTTGFADGSKTRLYVNGTLIYSDANFLAFLAVDWFIEGTGNGGEVGVAAIYPSAMSKKRIAAHAAHFCGLCRGGRGFVLGTTSFN